MVEIGTLSKRHGLPSAAVRCTAVRVLRPRKMWHHRQSTCTCDQMQKLSAGKFHRALRERQFTTGEAARVDRAARTNPSADRFEQFTVSLELPTSQRKFSANYKLMLGFFGGRGVGNLMLPRGFL